MNSNLLTLALTRTLTRAGKLVYRCRNIAVRIVLRVSHPTARSSDLVRLGSDYGGWWVPRRSIGPGKVAYCGGAGEDISFDVELHHRGCTVRCFDPTPRAVAFVEKHAPADERFTFSPTGWWSSCTELKFFAPRDVTHVSHSALNLQGTEDYFLAHVSTVGELAESLGDQHIDILKMDIEGAEFEVLGSLLSNGPLPAVLCVEFEEPMKFLRIRATLSDLRRSGYRLVKIENRNYTFVRLMGTSYRRSLRTTPVSGGGAGSR